MARDLRMPGPVEWFAWLDRGSEREREIAIVHLAARSAERAQTSRRRDRDILLTEYGIASSAASAALVLATPNHPNHTLLIERLQREELA